MRSPVGGVFLGVVFATALYWEGAHVAALQQLPRPTFQAMAEIVRVEVAVFAKGGGPVLDLTSSDFTVLQDGQERPLSVFYGPENGPMDVALVMDTSSSMARWESRDVFRVLLDGLQPDSCVLFLPFMRRVGRGLWAHPYSPELRQIVDQIPQQGDYEALYDALVAAFAALRDRGGIKGDNGEEGAGFRELMRFRNPLSRIDDGPEPLGECILPSASDESSEPGGARRSAVVIVADQADSASEAGLEDVLLASWGSGVPIFALSVSSMPSVHPQGRPVESVHRTWARELDEMLDTLARYTGGIILEAKIGRLGVGETIEGMQRLGQALQGRYTLGFVPAEGKEAGPAVIAESDIDVRVTRDDLEVLTTRKIITGSAKSEGAALDFALRGYREMAAGDAERALGTFDIAISMGPGLGLAHYGKALALQALGKPAESLAPLESAERLAPWLPDLAARLALAYYSVGDFEAAWEQAVRAHYGGEDVAGLIEDLKRVAPRAVDLTKPPVNPRVGVKVEGGSGMGSGIVYLLATPKILAAASTLIRKSPVMQGGRSTLVESSDLVLTVRVAKTGVIGPRLYVRGRMTLRDAQGREWAEESFRVDDLGKPDEAASALEEVFARIEEAVIRIHKDSDGAHEQSEEVAEVVAAAMQEVEAVLQEHLRGAQ